MFLHPIASLELTSSVSTSAAGRWRSTSARSRRTKAFALPSCDSSTEEPCMLMQGRAGGTAATQACYESQLVGGPPSNFIAVTDDSICCGLPTCKDCEESLCASREVVGGRHRVLCCLFLPAGGDRSTSSRLVETSDLASRLLEMRNLASRQAS